MRCLRDNTICAYTTKEKKLDEKNCSPSYVKLVEDRVVLLQKAVREIVRKLAAGEDLSYILPVGRYVKTNGDVSGRFSVNLMLDQLGVKLLDDDDPINNSDVLKDFIVLHKAPRSENNHKEDNGKNESLPTFKVKRGRLPKKITELPKAKRAKRQDKTESTQDRAQEPPPQTTNCPAVQGEFFVKPRLGLNSSGKVTSDTGTLDSAMMVSSNQALNLPDWAVSTQPQPPTQSPNSIYSVEDELFTSSSSSTPRSAHGQLAPLPQAAKTEVEPFSFDDTAPLITSSDTDLSGGHFGAQQQNQTLTAAFDAHEFSFLDAAPAELPIPIPVAQTPLEQDNEAVRSGKVLSTASVSSLDRSGETYGSFATEMLAYAELLNPGAGTGAGVKEF